MFSFCYMRMYATLGERMGASDFLFVAVVAALLVYSSTKDRDKTGQALRIAAAMLKKQLPMFATVFLLVGVLEAFLTRGIVQILMGKSVGYFAPFIGALVGGAATGPPAVAFPIANYLWKVGASQAAVAAFVVSWVSVGTVTLPMEIATYGRRFAITRWIASLIMSILIGLIIGAVL